MLITPLAQLQLSHQVNLLEVTPENVVQIENNQVQIQYRETERWQVLKSAVLIDGNSYHYPEFYPAGGEFLVIDDLARLCRYRFPDCHLMGTATLELEEEDYFGYYMCYLSDEQANCRGAKTSLRGG